MARKQNTLPNGNARWIRSRRRSENGCARNAGNPSPAPKLANPTTLPKKKRLSTKAHKAPVVAAAIILQLQFTNPQSAVLSGSLPTPGMKRPIRTA